MSWSNFLIDHCNDQLLKVIMSAISMVRSENKIVRILIFMLKVSHIEGWQNLSGYHKSFKAEVYNSFKSSVSDAT
jgi:hypothetical protein